MTKVLFFAGAFIGLFLLLAFANRLSSPKKAPTSLLSVRRLGVGDAVVLGLVVFFYPLFLLITARFWSATALGAGVIVLLWAGNRLKVAVLSETLVFSDIFLAGHALRYPRLYFGYAPVWIWPLLIFALGAGLWGMSQETSFAGLSVFLRIALTATALVLLFFSGWLLSGPWETVRRFLKRFPLSFDAQTDVWAYTPLGAALLHLLWHGQYRGELRKRWGRTEVNEASGLTAAVQQADRKHRLLIQAESFVLLHRLMERPSCTPTIDALAEKKAAGRLSLAWRGAYTMRTEFAVLTGIAPRQLQTYGFDPYRLAAMLPIRSLAWELKRQGYRTVVCHPNDGRFFDRFRVMRHLGFDEMIDLERLLKGWPQMQKAEAHCGRYIHDRALLTWAADYLKKVSVPTFLFVITMEAHGPWDKKKFPGAERLSEEERYEVHLAHLDSGVSTLIKAQEQGLRASVLMYGDHLPGLCALRRRTPQVPSCTPWVAWDETNADEIECGDEELYPEQLSAHWARVQAQVSDTKHQTCGNSDA